MKRGRSYDEFDIDNFYNKKRCISAPNSSTDRIIRSGHYPDLIESSTIDFRSKHLILDFKRRQHLLWICDDLLGPYYENYIHVADYSELDRAIDRACKGLAWKRLASITNHGYFPAGEFGRYMAKTNTLIVSIRELMLVHIEKSNIPGYNLFVRIEQKKSCDSMGYHFSCDAQGKIDHFRP